MRYGGHQVVFQLIEPPESCDVLQHQGRPSDLSTFFTDGRSTQQEPSVPLRRRNRERIFETFGYERSPALEHVSARLRERRSQFNGRAVEQVAESCLLG